MTGALATWSAGLGGGYTSRYRTGYFTLDGGTYPSASIAKTLGRRASLLMEGSYLSFGESYRRADFLPIGFGVRFSPIVNPERRGIPYVQVSPALIVTRLEVHNTTYMLTAITDDRGFTEVLPGLIVGAGIAGPIAGNLHLDLGLRYLCSTNVRDPERIISDGRLNGLSQVSVSTALALAL